MDNENDPGPFNADTPIPLDDDQLAPPAPRKRRKLNGTFSRADPRIDSTTQEVRDRRPAAYRAAMEEHRAQMETNRVRLAAERWIKETSTGTNGVWIFTPHNVLVAPGLVKLWDDNVGGQARRFHEATKDLRKQMISTRGVSVVSHSMRQTMTPNGHVDGFGDGDIPALDAFQDANELAANDTTIASLEVGRRGSSALPSPGLGATAMPWDFAGGDVSDLSGPITPRSRRSVSVGSLGGGPLPLPASAQPSPRGLTPGDVSRLLNAHQSAGGAGGEESMANDSQLLNESQLSKSDGRVDAENLLLYAKKTAAEIHPEPLFFSDLAPLSDTLVGTTARAFYNLLTLGTSGRVGISQPEAYGEIEITIRDGEMMEQEEEEGNKEQVEVREDEEDRPVGANGPANGLQGQVVTEGIPGEQQTIAGVDDDGSEADASNTGQQDMANGGDKTDLEQQGGALVDGDPPGGAESTTEDEGEDANEGEDTLSDAE